jgi:hypothetical protein
MNDEPDAIDAIMTASPLAALASPEYARVYAAKQLNEFLRQKMEQQEERERAARHAADLERRNDEIRRRLNMGWLSGRGIGG